MMKRILLATVAVAALAVPFAASANSDNAANVINSDGGCGIYVGGPEFAVSASLHSVTTSSGVSTLVCKGEVAPRGVSERIDDLGCGTPGGFTTDSHTVISAGGKVTLVCKVRS